MGCVMGIVDTKRNVAPLWVDLEEKARAFSNGESGLYTFISTHAVVVSAGRAEKTRGRSETRRLTGSLFCVHIAGRTFFASDVEALLHLVPNRGDTRFIRFLPNGLAIHTNANCG